jgi:hypothetical protein
MKPTVRSKFHDAVGVGRSNAVCAYCSSAPGKEDDHVIARQFFPPEQTYRGNLPKVPSCANCNRAKQRAEDTVGVYLPFGHASPASRQVIEDRIPRTLAKNERLARSLRRGARRTPQLVFELDDNVVAHIHDWFTFLTKGLYRHETGEPLPNAHSIHLLKPAMKKQYETLLNPLRRDSRHVRRAFAQSEFRYHFAISRVDPISGWLFAFKSADVFAVTLGPSCPEVVRASTSLHEWKRPAAV